MKANTPLYMLPGMTPDDRIFDRLTPLLPSCTIVNWLEPHFHESITDYAERLADNIPTSECFIGGVSFGGIVALEVCRIIRPRGCFLISSIRDPRQLPPWLRIWRLAGGQHCQHMLSAIGRLAVWVPQGLRTRSTTRVTKLAGDVGTWHRWATCAVLQWNPGDGMPGVPVCHIHGDADTTFPIRYTKPDVIVRSGGHLLPWTHAAEVAKAMLSVIATA